jgi:hypothetical protein
MTTRGIRNFLGSSYRAAPMHQLCQTCLFRMTPAIRLGSETAGVECRADEKASERGFGSSVRVPKCSSPSVTQIPITKV